MEQKLEYDKTSPFYSMIPLWNKRFNNEVYELIIPYKGEKLFGYFQKPDRIILMQYYTLKFNDDMESKEFLFNACKIEEGVDKRILDIDFLYASVIFNIHNLIEKNTSEMTDNKELFNTDNIYYDKIKDLENIYQLTIIHNGESYFAYFKKPNRDIIKKFYNYATQDIMTANNFIYTKCKLFIDPKIESIDDLYILSIQKAGDMMEFYTSEIKKKFLTIK